MELIDGLRTDLPLFGDSGRVMSTRLDDSCSVLEDIALCEEGGIDLDLERDGERLVW